MRAAIMLIASVLVALSLAAVLVTQGASAPNSSVTVLIPWEKQSDSSEFKAFMAVIGQFKQKYHVTVIVQDSRSESQQLQADLAAGDPPDVVDFPHPGDLYPFLNRTYTIPGEYLRPLQVSLKHYADPWRSLAMLGTHKVYAVPVKADVQSLIWYSTAVKQTPATWQALVHDSQLPGTPWCLGLSSGAVSGWPGTYWIANLILSKYGVRTYNDWISGKLHWDSPQVSYAWQEWETLLREGGAIVGGSHGALNTAFNKALGAGCQFEVGGLAASGLPSTTGYNYARFPATSSGPSPTLVSGDFMAQFTGNTNAATLLGYLASDRAQAIWVHQPKAHAFSADENLPLHSYPAGAERGIADMLRKQGSSLCFSPGALMATDMNTAFDQAVLEYINSPSSLPGLLKGLQKTRDGAGVPPLGPACPTSNASS
jgi:alpha-glucoside transport system substrate-binding protein